MKINLQEKMPDSNICTNRSSSNKNSMVISCSLITRTKSKAWL